MRRRHSGPQAVVSKSLLVCRGCVQSCSSIMLGQRSIRSTCRSWKRSSGKSGMTRGCGVPPWASWTADAASCRSAHSVHSRQHPARYTSNILHAINASCASHVDFTHPSCPLLRRLGASVRVLAIHSKFDIQEELQRAERQLDQERLHSPSVAPGQLTEHEAAKKSTLQDTQKRLQQALTEKAVSCCT